MKKMRCSITPVLALVASTAFVACGGSGNQSNQEALGQACPAALTASCPTTGDAQSCLQSFFSSGTAADTYILPAGTFNHSGVLNVRGHVQGAGAGQTVLVGTDPANRAIHVQGSGALVEQLSLTSATSSRLSTPQSSAMWLDTDVSNFELRNIEIYGKGGSAGVIMLGPSQGKVHNLYVHNTNADCIHHTSGAHDIEVYDNHIEHCGDDSIAVVGYSTNAMPYNINIHDNTTMLQDGGRGISCVGGHDVTIVRNNVSQMLDGLAGIYMAAEPAYGSVACHNVDVEGNTVKQAGGTNTGHSAILAWNGSNATNMGSFTLKGNQGYAPPTGVFIAFTGGNQGAADVENNISYQNGGTALDVATGVSPLTNVNNVVKPLSSYPGDIAPANTPSVVNGGGGSTDGGTTGGGTTDGGSTDSGSTHGGSTDGGRTDGGSTGGGSTDGGSTDGGSTHGGGTDGGAGSPCGQLLPNQSLSPNQQVVSCNGQYNLIMQGDGNLVLYRGGSPMWSTGTWGTQANLAIMQSDGNFVLYGASKAYWSTGTFGHSGARLVVGDDGKLAVSVEYWTAS
jgi:hypothetical protein